MRQPLTREAITAAAREILVREGLQGVSLRRVAANLGVTAPALYAHVIDKRDLLQGIAEQEFEAMIARFDAIDERDPVQRVRLQCHAYIEYARENPALFRAMFLFRPELAAEPRGDELPLATKAFEVLAAAVHDAMAEGGFAAGDERLTALTVWTAIHGAAIMILSGPKVDDLEEAALARSVVDTVMAGLRCGADSRVAAM